MSGSGSKRVSNKNRISNNNNLKNELSEWRVDRRVIAKRLLRGSDSGGSINKGSTSSIKGSTNKSTNNNKNTGRIISPIGLKGVFKAVFMRPVGEGCLVWSGVWRGVDI